jgi:hypothetical protein
VGLGIVTLLFLQAEQSGLQRAGNAQARVLGIWKVQAEHWILHLGMCCALCTAVSAVHFCLRLCCFRVR